MTWSGTGPYTQSNESNVSVSAVASVTGGIRVTANSHGYADGDFVWLNVTGYVGAYFVSAAAANTFDIIDQDVVFGSTATGTVARGDKDLSGLAALSGTTEITVGSKTIVYVGTTQVLINGVQCIDPTINQLSSDLGQAGVIVGSGAAWALGRYVTVRGYRFETQGIAYENGSIPGDWWQPGVEFAGDAGAFVIQNGGRLYWYGATAFFPSNGFKIRNGAWAKIRNGICVSGHGSADTGRDIISGFLSADIDVQGFTMERGEILSNQPHPPAIGLKRYAAAIAVFPNLFTTFEYVDLDVGLKGNIVDVPIQSEDNDHVGVCTVRNSATGTNLIIIGGEIGTDSRNRGTVKVVRRVQFTFSSLQGASLNALAWLRDRNNGRRKNLNSVNDTADKTYSWTASGGVTGTQDVCMGIVSVAGTNPRGTSNTSPYDIDFRGNSQVMGVDQFTVRVRLYGYLALEFPISLAGVGTLNQPATLLADPDISLAQATADAVTGVSLTDHGTSPVTWNSKQYDLTVTGNLTTNPSLTATQLKHYLWSQLCKHTSFGGFPSGLDIHDLVPVGGTVTARGSREVALLAGSITNSATSIALVSAASLPTAGTVKIENEEINYTGKSTNTLTGCTRGANGTTAAAHTGTSANPLRVSRMLGVRVVDQAGNSFPGITGHVSTDGTSYVPPTSVSVTLTGIVSGSRYRLEKVSDQTTVGEGTSTGGPDVINYTWTSDYSARLIVRKASGSPKYLEVVRTLTLTSSPQSVIVEQQPNTNAL